MDIMLLVLLALGFIAGVIAGIFGLGGGILFTPILFIVFSDAGMQKPVLLAIATSLFCSFISTTGSSIRQYRQNNMFWLDGTKVGLLGVAGVTLGKQVITSPYYNEKVFVLFFSLLLFYVAFMFYSRGAGRRQHNPDDGPVSLKQAGITGGLGGFVAALAGIGGGGVMVPIMNLFYHKPFQKAVSISSLAIVFIALSGWLQLAVAVGDVQALTIWHWGYVDFGAALPLAAGGLAGGFIGAWLNMILDRWYLQLAFAVLAVVMAVRLLAEVF